MYRHFFKRFIDIVLALIGIAVAGIPMLLIALCVKLESPGPALFKQERLGKNGKVFKMYKFRSMCVGAEKGGVYSDNKDTRVTRVGRIIRATSLDELPQFFNVLLGHMSFIGPRPPLTYHPWPLEEYSDFQRRMFEVRPGITGWTQTHGRKDVEWHRRIELNVWYVDHLTLWLDIKILFLTVFKVLTAADNENKGATLVVEDKQSVESGK
ncbi:MAG: sugar transferase [Oscillospiraceae bacterium]|nr:sugar transferase [Oscillospiraceae bacterium]